MKKLIILIFILFFNSCVDDYKSFHEQKNISKIENDIISDKVSNFSLDDIGYIDGLSIKHTPSIDLLEELVSKIENANNRVYLEVYIFTEKRLRKALKDANSRGVDVKVILERNVYMSPSMNRDSYNKLNLAGVDVVYSNQENYSLNHTKMMIVDDEVIISTGNYSYSAFSQNREFFLFLENREILEKLLEIFLYDYEGTLKNVYHNNLVLSPFYTRDKFEKMLFGAKESIKIYSLNFSDSKIEDILKQRSKEINIKMIFPSLKKIQNNKDIIDRFEKEGIKTKTLEKPSLHAKSILIDDKYLYIGSINFSGYSIDKNREIGLLISNKDIVDYFIGVFDEDFY